MPSSYGNGNYLGDRWVRKLYLYSLVLLFIILICYSYIENIQEDITRQYHFQLILINLKKNLKKFDIIKCSFSFHNIIFKIIFEQKRLPNTYIFTCFHITRKSSNNDVYLSVCSDITRRCFSFFFKFTFIFNRYNRHIIILMCMKC